MYSPTYFEKRLFLKIKQASHKYIHIQKQNTLQNTK